ncbi:FAD-dependent oxidoreductase [bacterium SCSIO 12696]|nr:FAD-dependent oxidoreductase [bacterium SCSIO 12696]
MDNNHLPFWFKEALATEQPQSNTPLCEHKSADICIVGGGYTGLWSAIKIKQQAPEKQVVVIDKGLCGEGASGRNGGCMLTFSTKFPTLRRLLGEAEAMELVTASEKAVFAIRNFCDKHRIDADVRVDGALYTASNPSQVGILRPVIAELERLGINRWQKCTAERLQQLSGSGLHLEGHYSPAAGSLQPAKLVRGLRRVAQEMGVEIYEHTPMTKLDYGPQVQVHTPTGIITADKVILAINAWMARKFRFFRRSLVLVSSDMVITEPMPEQLDKIGLNHGTAVVDSRTFVHYYRSTPDGRLMLGKGGNYFSYGNRVSPVFDSPSRYRGQLDNALQRFFPTLPHNIHQTWTGASDRSVTGLPFFGHLPGQPNVLYGFGYSGNGVVQSHLGGDILTAMALELDNSWRHSPLARGCRGYFPPEPLRTGGALMVRNAIRRVEARQDANKTPFVGDTWLAALAGSAGKADRL